MPKPRPSVQKRERENRKRERRLMKAAKRAEKGTAAPVADAPPPAASGMPRKDDVACLP